MCVWVFAGPKDIIAAPVAAPDADAAAGLLFLALLLSILLLLLHMLTAAVDPAPALAPAAAAAAAADAPVFHTSCCTRLSVCVQATAGASTTSATDAPPAPWTAG